MHYETPVENTPLMTLDEVLLAAQRAKANGASRFCMAAAWRSPKEKDLDKVAEMIKAVKALGLETCVTLGQLKAGQAQQLKEAGLDYYNHNMDTAKDKYADIVSTRVYEDRLETLGQVRKERLSVLLLWLVLPCLRALCDCLPEEQRWMKPHRHCVFLLEPTPFFTEIG